MNLFKKKRKAQRRNVGEHFSLHLSVEDIFSLSFVTRVTNKWKKEERRKKKKKNFTNEKKSAWVLTSFDVLLSSRSVSSSSSSQCDQVLLFPLAFNLINSSFSKVNHLYLTYAMSTDNIAMILLYYSKMIVTRTKPVGTKLMDSVRIMKNNFTLAKFGDDFHPSI